MAQVLVPVFAPGHDDEQYYRYFEESELPGLHQFNIGDKVRFCDDFVLVSHKTGEGFTADVEHTHIISRVDYWIEKKKYHYLVKIDPVVRHCGEAFSFWFNDTTNDENNWYDWFDEDELAPINSSSAVELNQSELVQV